MGVARSEMGGSPTAPADKWTEESKLDEMADASDSRIETLKGPTRKGGRGSDDEFDRVREATKCWRIERWKDLGRDLDFADDADGPGFVSTSPSSCKRLTQQEKVKLGEGAQITNGKGHQIRPPGPPSRTDGRPSAKEVRGASNDNPNFAAAEKEGGPGFASTSPSKVKSLVQEEE